MAVSAFAELAYTYFDRIAVGDTARAQLVLNETARVFGEFHEDIVSVAVSGGVPAGEVPASPVTTAAQTRTMLMLALLLGWASRVTAAVRAMPTTPTAVAAWFPQLRSAVGTAPALTATVASASVADLTRNLSGMVNEQIYGVRVGMPTSVPTPAPPPPAPVLVTPIQPPITVYGSTGRWTMPTWGWWALGLGLATAVGYTGYRVWKQA